MTELVLARDPLEEWRQAFTLFDEDTSGRISLKNLRRVARELGETLADDELRAMIDEFDRDGDGESAFVFCTVLILVVPFPSSSEFTLLLSFVHILNKKHSKLYGYSGINK